MEENLKKSYPGIAQSFIITGIVILGTLIFAPVGLLLNEVTGKEAAALIYYLLSMGIPLWIVSYIRKRKANLSSFNIHFQNPRILVLIMVATIALVFGIISPLSDLIPLPESMKESLVDAANQKGMLTFILMVIAAPVLEELLFRGIMLDGLLKKYTPVKSIVITSLLFGIVHLNPWQFVAGFIIGLFIGWIYYETKSVAYSIIIHATANLCGYLLRVFSDADSLINNSFAEMYGGMANLIVISLGACVIIFICIYFLGKEFREGRLKLAVGISGRPNS